MNDAYHFKTERTVYHEQYNISDFSNVNHTTSIEVVAFDKSVWFFLPLTTVIGIQNLFAWCLTGRLSKVVQVLPTPGGPTRGRDDAGRPGDVLLARDPEKHRILVLLLKERLAPLATVQDNLESKPGVSKSWSSNSSVTGATSLTVDLCRNFQ